ncbi:ParA family protein [Pseudomonas sp. BN606]|uniref:ParA family protein n=1 Tax=Pseudomonas sp. BN606 TaxID=2567894 RepID=UPI0024583FB1|nr:ParA family protein [Pseudomonas sp. BN606]MDH4652177.1 ParA family protein [Pseudomonas sp. BN606]
MKTISFVNMKGGVGKTTLALNVAHCLARMHSKKVAVIDVDPQFNATQCLFSGAEYVELLKRGADTAVDIFDSDERPIASVVSGVEASKPKNLEDIQLQEAHGLWILPGNIDLYRLEMVAGEGREFSLKRFVEEKLAAEGFDYVIIDTPPTPSTWMTSALIASDYYIIPVKPDPLSLIGIDLLRTIIERRKRSYSLNLKCLGVVLTMVERPDSVLFGEAMRSLKGNEFWKKYVFECHLPKKSDLARQQLEQPFILLMEDYSLRKKLNDIVDKIIKGVEGVKAQAI